MKTDRFDEEFRRKLQDLPVDATKTAVERTYAYVRTNNPVGYGVGWSRWLPYGAGGMLLLGSLLYNGLQHAHTTRLQASLDSLSRQSTRQPVRPGTVQHDTIYITRSEKVGHNSSAASPNDYPKTAANPTASPSVPSAPHPADETTSGETRRVARGGQHTGETPIGTATSARPADVSVETGSPTGRITARTESPHALGRSLPTPSSPGRSQRFGAKTTRRVAGPILPPLPEPEPADVELVASPVSTSRRVVVTARSSSRRANRPDNELTQPNRRVGTMPSVSSSGDDATAEATRLVLTAEPIATRPVVLAGDLYGRRLVSRSLTAPKPALAASKTPLRRHLIMPRLSVPGAHYRVGTSFAGADGQLSGAVLGEWQINRYWSVQGGVQVSRVDGFHYHDEQDFGKHRNKDFRQTFDIVGIASSAEIDDIRLLSTLVQVPLQVAYHQPLGGHWGLRLGLGTELDLAVRSTVDYTYRENNRSNEYNLSIKNGPATIVNNLTVSTSLERTWKRWQFRAGPFISPHIRSVSYKSDDLLWGGNVQVFYRPGK